MQLVDGRYIYSASDLNDYLECKRLTELNALVACGRADKPQSDDETAALVRLKGEQHEARYLEELRTKHGDDRVVAFDRADGSLHGYRQAADRTSEAMAHGVPFLYQATFFDGQFIGHADFLRRIETPSTRWSWSYEVLDTKLAMNAKPYFVVQLCNYSEHLARLQGSMPAFGYIVLGDGTVQPYRLHDYLAYYRHLKARFLSFAGNLEAAAPDVATHYPLRCGHCGICEWNDACKKQRVDDDHLSGVAWMRRDQIETFEAAHITTIEQLARAADDARPNGMPEKTFTKLRRQARLQVEGRERGEHVYELLPHAPPMGFAMMPAPATGDVFFDMEGDPLYEPGRGLEYLFGCWLPDDAPHFKAFWGCDRDAEKRAFEDFVDFIVERRRRYPDLHVYHYAPYEKTTLRRLAQQHCSREAEIDHLLRGEVFVDLYAVVRQAIAISEDSYSLKKVEQFYEQRRATEVKKGDESIVMFERWLADPDDRAILDDIEAYNRDDCESTYRLRQWLLQLRSEAAAKFGNELAFRPLRDPSQQCHSEFLDGCKECGTRRTLEREEERRSDLERRLLGDILIPKMEQEYAVMCEDHRMRFLLANVLAYHRREERPQYWAYFDRRENLDGLKEFDKEAIAELELCAGIAPVPEKKSTIYTYRFPDQPYKLGIGDTPHNPLDEPYKVAGTIVALDENERTLQLKRTGTVEEAAAITALIPASPLSSRPQRESLDRIAEAYLGGRLDHQWPATYALLTARRPRVHGIVTGEPIQPPLPTATAVSAIVQQLDRSHLFVQGPPGSGKTTIGAHVVADLLQAGQRVAIASTGHKAIHNLLHKVEAEMQRRGRAFRGLHKHSNGNGGSKYHSHLAQPFIASLDDNKAFQALDYELASGTSWLFSREALVGAFDYLFIDEAGQVSLADALAMSSCAENVVLLGDPSQLAQVSQGLHPLHAGDSVLEHLLGAEQTVPLDRGIFLDRSYRMQPDICRFISEAVYENRLKPDPSTASHAVIVDGQRLAGLRYAAVAHTGNSSRSIEEADYILNEIKQMRVGGVRDCDILIITPYNAQRRLLERKLKDDGIAVEVGTVDKFQGREAEVVFYSMASSSGEDAPRDMTFLFERNRFNVAVSRARALSVLVCSPTLLETSCRNAEQMALVNLLCAFADAATQRAEEKVAAAS